MHFEFELRVWAPLAAEPVGERIALGAELALDRDLLRVQDATVSRAANAPVLTPAGKGTLELVVPVHSARAVLVIQSCRFETLQARIPPASEPWKIAPPELTKPCRLARAEQASLALVSQIAWDRPDATHHLLALPRARWVPRGERCVLAAPALIVIGEAAVDVTPTHTAVPSTLPIEPVNGLLLSFRLSDVERYLPNPERLDAFDARATADFFILPDWDGPVRADELSSAASVFVGRSRRSYCFLPVLEEGRRPRLALAYARRDDSAAILVSGPDPAGWLQELESVLSRGSAAVAAPAAPVVPSARRSASVLARNPPAAEPSADPDAPPIAQFGGLETRNPELARTLDELARTAASDIGLLLLGESGTGKEYVADAVHRASPRAKGPFVSVNCSAISEQLIESELFGHKRGAFTGAHGDRTGAFASAHGGTLFLDEIGDAPQRVQHALLRVLETRRIKPVGADTDRAVDVRVLAATSRDVRALMLDGRFREDLYFRLAELTVELPPLRDRREDILPLAEHLLGRLGSGERLSSQARSLLVRHDWPGNIRELRNAIKRALALASGVSVLEAIHFSQLGELGELREGDAGPTDDSDAADRRGSVPPPALGRPLAFPARVELYADRLRHEGRAPGSDSSAYQQRALDRAALLYLATRVPVGGWAPELGRLWQRLFGAKWATTESGRALRDVLREIGADPRDTGAAEAVLAIVARRGR